jgi:general secretion pathway protein D
MKMGNLVLFAAAVWLAVAGAAATPPGAWGAPPSVADRETAPVPSSPTADDQAPPAADNEALSPPPPAADNQAAPPGPGDGQAPAPAPAGRDAKPPVYLSMDFTDVDLPVLIKFISEQTRRNFIFDERIQGKITIISPRKITVDEAFEVFLSVLQVKGFTTVEAGRAIKIVPLRDIKQESIPLEISDGSSAKYITQLIPLQYVDAAEVVPLLAPIISRDGLIASFPASNTLLLIDSRSNIGRIERILAEVDAAGAAATLRIFPMANAFAPEIAKTLETLYQEGPPTVPGPRARAGRPGRSRGIQPKFIPDARTNSLIVLAGSEVIGDIEELIRNLDIPTPEHTGKINVYYLEHADAEELARVLSALSEHRPGAVPAAAQQPGQQQAVTVKGIITAELEGGVKITADKATNSLIIIASPHDYQTLLDVIGKLDIPRRQVYVESLIMEISLDRARDVGVEFRGAAETSDGAILTGTNFDFRGNVNELLTALAIGNPLVFSGTGLIAGGILGRVVLPDGTEIPAITAVLRAAQSRDNINVLSSPHLLTLDNKEAEILVGENVPFITSQARDITNLANIISTIERVDVGITLRITPQIHESEFVSLDIYQESSDVTVSPILDANLVGPTTTKRSAKTTVLVRNGQTVVLGGMMQERTNTVQRQIPILGDIPILGNLFKFKSASRRKTNLLLFLTPHIIKQPEDMARVTDKERRRMDRFIEEHEEEVEQFLKERTGTGVREDTSGPEAGEAR